MVNPIFTVGKNVNHQNGYFDMNECGKIDRIKNETMLITRTKSFFNIRSNEYVKEYRWIPSDYDHHFKKFKELFVPESLIKLTDKLEF